MLENYNDWMTANGGGDIHGTLFQKYFSSTTHSPCCSLQDWQWQA